MLNYHIETTPGDQPGTRRIEAVMDAAYDFDSENPNLVNGVILAGICAVGAGAEIVNQRLADGPRTPWRTLGSIGCRLLTVSSAVVAYEYAHAWHEQGLKHRWTPSLLHRYDRPEYGDF
jgi:hypothetical protein